MPAEGATPVTTTAADLARAISGDAEVIARLAIADAAQLADAASRHGVLPLLVEQLPLDAFRARLQQDLFADILRESELKRAIADLDRAGVHPLVVKGGQLAYTHYPRPDLRPRIDTDLLIPPAAKAALHETLAALGYEKKGGMSGELVSYQSMYVKWMNGTPVSALDVHWKIANAQVFADVLEYDELLAASVPIAALGPAARGLSSVHALFLACVHRVAHHLDSDKLIWLYDIHLLAGAIDDEGWRAFTDLAAARRVVSVCRRSLERTAEQFGTTVPAFVWSDPRWTTDRPAELSAGYLTPRRNISAIADDLRALPSWRARWNLAREHLMPPAHYMRTVFAPGSRAPLFYLHARRLLRGARKWLKAGG